MPLATILYNESKHNIRALVRKADRRESVWGVDVHHNAFAS
jgi:hypothetical protein